MGRDNRAGATAAAPGVPASAALPAAGAGVEAAEGRLSSGTGV